MIGKRFKVREEIYASITNEMGDVGDRLLKPGKEFLVTEQDWLFTTIRLGKNGKVDWMIDGDDLEKCDEIV